MDKEKENRRQFKKYFKYFKIISFFVILSSILYYLFKDTDFIKTIVKQIKKIPLELYIIIIVFLFIYIIEKFLFYKYINFFIKKYIFITICLSNSLFIILPLYLYLNEKINKCLFFVFSITFSISFILYCFVLIAEKINQNNYNLNKSNKEIKKNTYTLWDIYTGNFNDKDLKNLKIEDSDKIEHDLFGRTPIVNNLYDSITNFKERSDCFTIGVVGEWGSGKSSIIELTKNKILNNEFKDKFIIIDDFDPWAIKSQDALILAMYNTIMENLGENIGYFKRKKVQNALINITTNIPYIGKGIGSFFENRIDDYTEYKKIKADLEEKLEKFDKRLIFIIDNLDRMNSDNVLFLLTLIGTLFKLRNITYIVAYDKNRLKKVFRTGKIDSKYIEKIISQEIIVPKIHVSDKQYVFYSCLKNCIYGNYYEKRIKNFKDTNIEKILKIIASKFDNNRHFIKFLNFIIYDINSTYLNKEDFLIIRTIEFLDYELYKKIYQSITYFTKVRDSANLKYHSVFTEIENNDFFDLLKHLSNVYSNVSNFEYPCDSSICQKTNLFCNKFYFENYFSKNNYSEEYIQIKEYFNYTDIDYKKAKIFFDEDEKYLKWEYIIALNTYLEEIVLIIKDDNLLRTRLSIFIYFLEKIINGLFFEYINSDRTIYNQYKYILKYDTEKVSNYNSFENTEYFRLIKNIFITSLKYENFSKLNMFKDFFHNSHKFFILSKYYTRMIYIINYDETIEKIEKSQKIIEKSQKYIDFYKQFIYSENITQNIMEKYLNFLYKLYEYIEKQNKK